MIHPSCSCDSADCVQLERFGDLIDVFIIQSALLLIPAANIESSDIKGTSQIKPPSNEVNE